jgi:hypothetical protein
MHKTDNDEGYFSVFVGLLIILFILLICGCVYCNKSESFAAVPRAVRPRVTRPRAARPRAAVKPKSVRTVKPKKVGTRTVKPKMPTSKTILRSKPKVIVRGFFGNIDFDRSNSRNYVTIYSISNSPYQEWQADLLDYSFAKSGQPGSLVRLVSEDLDHVGREVALSSVGDTFSSPAYEGSTGAFKYKPMNKPGALGYFLNETEVGKKLDDSDIVLLVDPDMIFTKEWTPDFKEGTVFGQKWKGYSRSFCKKTSTEDRFCPRSDNEAVMYPFAIYVKDLRKIVQDYYEFSKHYAKTRNWMQEMTALVLAMEKNGLKIDTEENIGICNNWDNNNDEDAPLVHYCQTVKDKDGKELWGKHRYTPGDKVPDPEVAQNRVDRIVLETLHELYN